MDEMLTCTSFGDNNMPNHGAVRGEVAAECEALLTDVIAQARKHMTESHKAYKTRMEDPILAELGKLEALKDRHKEHIREKYEQLSILGKERKRDQEERHIDELFEEFFTWVEESMEIQDNPYIRVIAVFTGVSV